MTVRWKLVFGVVLFLAGCEADVNTVQSCGDGFVDPGEECDLENLDGESCAGLGYYDLLGTLRCAPDCRFDVSACGGRCGDGIVDDLEGEQCEEGVLIGANCQSLGYEGGQLACAEDCTFDIGGCTTRCGNGVIEPGEACDDGNGSDGDGCDMTCEPEPGWDCEVGNPTICESICGDGLVVGEEACDDGNLAGGTCAQLGYHAGVLACSDACRFDPSGCVGRCGDGVLDSAFEACDLDDLGQNTCETRGYHPGVLSCGAGCELITSGCGGACGDGAIQGAFEDCEGSDLQGATCRDLGHYLGELTCEVCQYGEDFCLDIVKITGGMAHTCALLSDGTVRCWGQAAMNGDGTMAARNSPVPVLGLQDVVDISAGVQHTCAVRSDGTLWCWGVSQYPPISDGTSSGLALVPMLLQGSSGFVRVAAGGSHTCAVDSEGLVWCWGYGYQGQLGNGVNTESLTPVQVVDISGVTAIAAHETHTCAVISDGMVACWGSNYFGQLGNGSSNPSNVPVLVLEQNSMFMHLYGAIDVSVGATHSCARMDGVVKCWGSNQHGQIGVGTFGNYYREAQAIADFPPPYLWPVSVSTGYEHTCVAMSDGTARCWGSGGNYQLTYDSTESQASPVPISNVSGAVSVASGHYHNCVIWATGGGYCWGWANDGQLGDGNTLTGVIQP